MIMINCISILCVLYVNHVCYSCVSFGHVVCVMCIYFTYHNFLGWKVPSTDSTSCFNLLLPDSLEKVN